LQYTFAITFESMHAGIFRLSYCRCTVHGQIRGSKFIRRVLTTGLSK